jgi:hypothetical protein
MALQHELSKDLTFSMRTGDKARVGALRIAISELQREPQKDVPDDRVIKILKKLVSDEKTLASPDQDYVNILESYLPKEATDEEIRAWITTNIDFSQFKNRMQAMKPVMSQFAGRADGNRVKDILNSL